MTLSQDVFSSCSELLHFENSPKKDIKTLLVKAYSQDLETRVWLKFGKDLSRNIFLLIEGEEDIAIKMNERIEECLSAVKPWYAVLAQIDFTKLLEMIIAFILIVLFFGVVILRFSTASSSSNDSQLGVGETSTGLLIGFSVLALFWFVLSWIRSTFFPMGVFALGQGAKRHEHKELIRTLVILGFVISLVSGILVTLIFAL